MSSADILLSVKVFIPTNYSCSGDRKKLLTNRFDTIVSSPKRIAQYLNLLHEGTYTGLGFRRSSSRILADEGGDMLYLKRLPEWKSTTFADCYVDSSMEGQ